MPQLILEYHTPNQRALIITASELLTLEYPEDSIPMLTFAMWLLEEISLRIADIAPLYPTMGEHM